ncbi:hypothetical protein AMS57_06550 [Pseudoalteromonas undina]|uniref:hypothetical protein n=1 Tax=Pseudoalteromonas undina TaxID=43660 RepID=UPI0006BADCB6|nr:hypothetical protein [Pseudoalteromonas undina]KPH91741.1 hypothetical protein AMS57_06550 [Pseudoalteromonas undina]
MQVKQLSFFPRLQGVLATGYKKEVIDLLSSAAKAKGSEIAPCLNVYYCFVDISVRTSGTPYSALDIRNNEITLNTHLSALIGFIYKEVEASLGARYKYAHYFKKVFAEFAGRYGMHISNIKISDTRLVDDTNSCITLYQSITTNTQLIEYYSGWMCKDKLGNSHMLHLATWCDTYGAEFTSLIHTVISNFTITHKTTRISSILSKLLALLNEFTLHCKTKEALERSLKCENSPIFMEEVLNSMLFKSMIKNHDPKNFTKNWTKTIQLFNKCFIETSFFEEPLKPFLMPEFKEPKTSSHSISTGGDLKEEEKDRWLTDIPLEIKDETALEVIQQRLNLDLEHIRTLTKRMFEGIQSRQKRNKKFVESGEIKPLPSNTGKRDKIPTGINHLKNTVATFHHHGFAVGSRTSTFLGFDGQGDALIEELNLPTTKSLNIIASLLILEHPKITPSWLQEWELYDRNGNQVGLKQTGKQWIAVSFKNRKGATTAQQEVILTDYTKTIIDVLIEHTSFARDTLKNNGGSDWRYMMLTATLQVAILPKNLGQQLAAHGPYQKALAVESYDNNQQALLNQESATNLAKVVTPRSIRRARGLQIYLKTQSLKAVAEALGHKEIRLELLEVYLPKPLMEYFNKRWIRQFQNAIIFEALKDSPYLFDALDFDESALDEFLKNHRLGDLPDNLQRISANEKENKEYINNLDELVFTLSTPLLQVLLAIQSVIDNAKNDEVFIPIINKWYQSAVFILNHFQLSQKGEKYRRPPEEAIPLYESALNNPLNLNVFKENILFHSN